MFIQPHNKNIISQPNQGDGYRYLLISLFLLLLCFFVMLNSVSDKNNKKAKNLSEHVRYEFAGKDLKDKVRSFKNSGSIVGSYKVFGIRENLEKFLVKNRYEETDVSQFDKYLTFSLRNTLVFFDNEENLKYTGINVLREVSKLLYNYNKYGNLSVEVIINSTPDKYDLTLKRIKKIRSIISYDLRKEGVFKFAIAPYEKQEDNRIKFIISLND